jgi:enamine deaminase RidA (YjgF/YER057c/UK114 family)
MANPKPGIITLETTARSWVTGVRSSVSNVREILAEGIETLSMITDGADAQAAVARAHDVTRDAIAEIDKLLERTGLDLTADARRHLFIADPPGPGRSSR